MEAAGEFLAGSKFCIYLSRFLAWHLVAADIAIHVEWVNNSRMRKLKGGKPVRVFFRYEFGCNEQII